MVKEIDELRYYAKELKAEIDYLTDVNKTGEPRLGGIHQKIAGLNKNIDAVEALLTKKEEPKQAPVLKPEPPRAPAGVARIDVKTGIKKVVQP